MDLMEGGWGHLWLCCSEMRKVVFSQAFKLLCSSSPEGRAKKSGEEVPLTSHLRPH